MQSFYGGQRGLSFDIVTTYDSFYNMVNDFKSPNCTVGFGQYVSIISNDADNGSIYKRTTMFNNGQSGAVKVAQVKGLDGQSAQMKIVPYSSSIFDNTAEQGSFSISSDVIAGTAEMTEIPYKSIVTKDSTTGIFTTSLGIQIPYTVVDFTVNYTDTDSAYIERNDLQSGAFYQKFTLDLPKTLNGDSIQKIFIVQKEAVPTSDIYDASTEQQIISSNEDIIAYTIKKYNTETFTENGIQKERIVATFKNYKICNFSMIKGVDYDYHNSILTFAYEDSVIEIPIKQITDLSLGADGVLTATYLDKFGAETYIVVTSDGDPVANHWYVVENGRYILATENSQPPYYKRECQSSVRINEQTPIKWITSIDLDEYQNLIITYNTGEVDSCPTPARSIKELTYDENTGVLSITYENYSSVYTELTSEETANKHPVEKGWYERNETTGKYFLSQDQNVVQDKIYYKRTISPLTENLGIIKSIKDIDYDDETRLLNIYYNTSIEPQSFEINIRELEYIEKREDDKVYIKYSDETEAHSLFDVPTIKSVGLNNQNQIVLGLENNRYIKTPQSIDYPAYIEFNNATQQLDAIYNTAPAYVAISAEEIAQMQELETVVPALKRWYEKLENNSYFVTTDTIVDTEKNYYKRILQTKETISPPLNYIERMLVEPDNYHLLVLFSDPQRRTQPGTITYDNISGWVDLGRVRDTSGLWIDHLILDTSTSSDFQTIESTINYLTTQYPNGYQGKQQSVIAIGGGGRSNKILYAFEQGEVGWYYLGTFAPDIPVAAAFKESDEVVQRLPVGGIWFIQEEVENNYEEITDIYGPYWEDF